MVGKIIIMIRNDLTTILGEELRFLAIQTRQRLNLTQKEMGERLHMSYSNYSDIETGQIECCSTLTAILLLGMHKTKKAPEWVPFQGFWRFASIFPNSTPDKRACRSPSGKCEPWTDRLYSLWVRLWHWCYAPRIASRCTHGAICTRLACASTDSLALDYEAFGSNRSLQVQDLIFYKQKEVNPGGDLFLLWKGYGKDTKS